MTESNQLVKKNNSKKINNLRSMLANSLISIEFSQSVILRFLWQREMPLRSPTFKANFCKSLISLEKVLQVNFNALLLSH
jgi:hypothetical protein